MKNLEVFYSKYSLWCDENGETEVSLNCDTPPEDATEFEEGEGWFFWFCLPGCLPDSEPFGPYQIQEDAYAAAQKMFVDDE